ncbi:transposase [Cuniculiplasma sp. SKW4]|uniref:transposase n=1 Tax=Cuniculiplasma sp. SKW4 TaxID=3400171 RepID=UPI003FD63859
MPESNDSFSEKGITALKNIRFNNRKDLVLNTIMDMLEFPERQKESLDVEISKMASNNEDVKFLMAVPGIDYYLASLLSSCTGDVNRFPREGGIFSYAGLVPRIYQSGYKE